MAMKAATMDTPIRPPEPARVALRASDMDRERVATMLRESYSDGRLALDEFQERLEQALVASPCLVGGQAGQVGLDRGPVADGDVTLKGLQLGVKGVRLGGGLGRPAGYLSHAAARSCDPGESGESR